MNLYSIKKLKIRCKRSFRKGFSLVEVILSIALMMMIVLGVSSSILYAEQSAVLLRDRSQAVFYAEEAVEAVRNIRDSNFGNVVDGTYGLAISSNNWIFSGTSDKQGIYTRKVEVSSISSGIKRITATVTWSGGSYITSTDLTDWRAPLITGQGGMLVYSNGAKTSDSILYKTLSGNGIWSAANPVADVDATTTNKAAINLQLYKSPTGNQKVLLSKHFGSGSHFLYAQVFNGTSWGNVQLLSSWVSVSASDTENFSGTFQNNGSFVAVYSDNSTTPKMRVWNGTTWGSQVSLKPVAGIPNTIIAKARPQSNEIMVATLDSASDTYTQYFNGTAYSTANWTLHAAHATAAPSPTNRTVDIEWSRSDNTIASLVYLTSVSDRRINSKIWTSNRSGGGSWSSTSNGPNQSPGTTHIVTLDLAQSASNFFTACTKNTTSEIYCMQQNSSNSWTSPTNQVIGTTDTGVQRSFHMSYEKLSGNPEIIIYNDLTNIPKLKKFNTSTNTWDSGATNVGTLNSNPRVIRLINSTTDDIMITISDVNNSLSTVVWDGQNDALYTTPAGKSLTQHGTNGYSSTSKWFDFSWD